LYTYKVSSIFELLISDRGYIMEHDERILNYIAKDENISQRQLAKLTDLSLGHLNLLLHKLVSKGLLKIEKLNPRSLRYILTPQGIARNTKRAYFYIRDAVKYVLILKGELEQIVKQYESLNYTVYLDGEKDEIYQILRQATSEKKLSQVRWLGKIDELKNTDKKRIVVVWQSEKEQLFKTLGIEYINLIYRIDIYDKIQSSI